MKKRGRKAKTGNAAAPDKQSGGRSRWLVREINAVVELPFRFRDLGLVTNAPGDRSLGMGVALNVRLSAFCEPEKIGSPAISDTRRLRLPAQC